MENNGTEEASRTLPHGQEGAATRTRIREDLFDRWLEPDRFKPGPAETRVLPRSVSVWALIGQLQLDGWDSAAVAEDYELPLEAVETAILFYRQHQPAIDARIARNRAVFQA
ncbi:MAG: hypothetical protein ACR2PL_14705 [Dehalococcoidia bacterium]